MDIGDAKPRERFARSAGVSIGQTRRRPHSAPTILSDPWLMEQLLATSAGATLVVNQRRSICAANPAALDCFQVERSQIIDRSLSGLIGTAVYQKRLRPVLDAALKGEAGRVELTPTGRLEHSVELEFHCRPFRERDGQVSGAFVHGRDVTDNLRLKSRFRNLIEASLQGIFVHRDWTPLFANDACARIFGYDTALELLNSFESMDELLVPGESQRLKAYGEARMQGEAVPEEY